MDIGQKSAAYFFGHPVYYQ